MTDQTTTEEFHAFPEDAITRREAQSNVRQPYHSPHHPNNKPRIAAAGIAGTAYQDPSAHIGVGNAAQSAPVGAPVVHVQPNVSVTPNSEPEGVSLALPSQFAYYDFKDVYAKPFKGIHLGKVIRAREEESTLHLVEAVSSVLSSTSGVNNIAFYLTPADFYFVLYWLRLNSFTKSVFIHNTVCRNPKHLEQVSEEKAAAETLKHSEVIHKSTLQTRLLEVTPHPWAHTLDYPDVTLRVPLMLDAIEMTEDPKIAEPEFAFAATIAACLQTPEPTTLQQRVDIVNDMSADDIATVQAYEKAISAYGIVEEVKWVCKTCGQAHTDKIELTTHNFFPSAA